MVTAKQVSEYYDDIKDTLTTWFELGGLHTLPEKTLLGVCVNCDTKKITLVTEDHYPESKETEC